METNPAWQAFAAAVETELLFGQVLIRREGNGFELRHSIDKSADPSALRLLRDEEIRPLAQSTVAGAFRPLKSAPNLRNGWRWAARDTAALGAALNQFYPGAVADWFAARATPPITSYRDFTARQTGMYAGTAALDDATAGAVIRACCHEEFCLKRRLWTVAGLAADAAPAKSLIPCLEPCAILLEFARKMGRVAREQPAPPPAPDPSVGEVDFDQPANPRRVRFLLELRRASAK